MDTSGRLAEFELRTSLVDHTVLIHSTDGRAFKGRLVCVDGARNAMLQSATEIRPPAPYTTRYVGPVMVPGAHIVRVEVKPVEYAPSRPSHGRAWGYVP